MPVTAPFVSRLLACAAFVVAASPAAAETLAEAVAQAYQSNPTIQANRAQLRALNETYVQARSQFGPRLSASVTASYEHFDDGTHRLSGTSDSQSLSLSQPIFSGGRYGAGLQAAEADVRAGRERLRQAEANLIQQVIQAYTAVRRDEQTVVAAREAVTALKAQLEETQAKVDVRENTRTDLAQAQARLASSEAQVYSLEAQLANSRAQYLAVVGHNPTDLEPEPDLPGLPEDIDAAFDAAEAGNNTLLAAKYAELGSRARVTAARTQYAPSVNLQVQGARSPQALYLPDPYSSSVVAQATVTQPLFTAGQTGSAVRRALETNNADRLTIDSTRRNVVQTVSQQWSLLAASRHAMVADQVNVSSSETAFFGMREEERFGLRSTIEVLNAQQELTAAQISLLRDRYSEYVARAGLLNVMGRLTVDLLAPGVQPYDMEADFDRVKNKGALPTELIPRALDSLVTGPADKPLPARETTVPDRQLDLPPPPPPAAEAPPLRSLSDLMKETQREEP